MLLQHRRAKPHEPYDPQNQKSSYFIERQETARRLDYIMQGK